MTYIFSLIRKLLIISFLALALLVLAILYYMEFQLPDTNALNTVQLQVPLQIFTHDKKLIATFGEKRRIPLAYKDIPKPLIQAVLATEDQRYFQHPGIDIPGLGRAAILLALTGKKLQGGSTITMQVARSFYLSRNKTFGRKLREILLAIKIEHRLTKEKILELYLNKILFGNRAYGVEAAAEIYYGKHLKDLTIDQFAMLAGIPKAPSTLNPLANREAAKKRRDHVLGRMFEQGYINKTTYDKAIATPLNASYHDLKTEVKAPYVAELVREQLEQMYGESIYTDGFKVYTTADSKLQNLANVAVRDNLLAYDKRHGYRGASANWGTPSLSEMEIWQQKLSRLPVVNELEPAAVFEMSDQSISVLRTNGDLTIIPWSGLSWARKQISNDYLGPRPRSPQDILKLGDIVRIGQTSQGFELAQIPKAEAGLVTLNPINGAILAMVGGFDYQSSNFNRITNAERQPGSSFKPFVYSAAFDKGYTLATVINDAPIVIENPADNSLWRPQNDTHQFYGPTRLRDAIIQSRNLVSIRILDLMGLNYALDYLQRFGFSKAQLPEGLSLALGTALVTPLQMAQAYAIFANGGLKVVPYIIDSIQNSQDVIIYQAKPMVACHTTCPPEVTPAPRAITAQNAYLINSALRDVIQNAKGTAAIAKKLGRNDLAGKTGTTQNQVDAWFVGYNPDIVTVSWMGFDQPQSLHEYGAKAALPMWMQFMQSALKGQPEHPFERPEGIVTEKIDPMTGNTTDDPSGINEVFMQPYVPGNEQSTESKDISVDNNPAQTEESSPDTTEDPQAAAPTPSDSDQPEPGDASSD